MLTSKQEQAILAILESSSRQEAAERAGVHVQSIFKWLHLPEFRQELNDARRRLREKRIDLLAERQLTTAATSD